MNSFNLGGLIHSFDCIYFQVDQLKKPDVLLELINTLTDGVVGGAKVPATPVRKPKENKKEIAYEMIDKFDKKYGKIEWIDRTDESSFFQSDRPDKSWPESVNWIKGKRRENCKENFQSIDVKLNELDSAHTSVDYYSVTTGREESFRVRESSNKFKYFHDSLDNVKESCEKPVHKTGSSYEMTRNSNIDNSEILTDSKYSAHKIKTARNTEGFDAAIKDFNENKAQESFKRTENNNRFKSEFFPNKVKTGKGVEPVRDLSKYVTPWDELMPQHREIKRGWQHFDRVFIVSSLTGDGMEDLKVSLEKQKNR